MAVAESKVATAPAPPRVAIVTGFVAHFKAPFYQRLFERTDVDVHVFCQDTARGINLTLVHDRDPDRITVVPAFSTHRERLVWQRLPWGRLLSQFDVLFVVGNPRMVSSVVLALVASVLRRPVVIFGQAHTSDANPFTERLRLAWWRWFSHLFVYTDGEVARLKARGFTTHHIVGMNNGLDQRRIDAAAHEWTPERLAPWRTAQGLDGRTVILSCARLEAKNRFDLWIEAMPALAAEYPDLMWCIIGDGVERERLQQQAAALRVADRIRWIGTVTDDAELAPWFLSSRLLVHPGAIGLTLLHAFGFGVPVVTSDDAMRHMPEFDAFEDGRTGRTFARDSVSGLADAVRRCLADAEGLRCMAARGRQIAREAYNVDVMAERFVASVRQALPSGSLIPES
jgi:glycosyltransferase involved in cell wall biosynthesis